MCLKDPEGAGRVQGRRREDQGRLREGSGKVPESF